MNKNITKNIIYAVLIIILLSMQSGNTLAIKGVFPDFMMILVILHAIHFGAFKGELFGFGIGMLSDVMSGTLFGLNAFVFTFLAWFTNFYRKFIQVSDVVAFLLYIVVATIIKYIFYSLFHWIFHSEGFFGGYFFLKMLGEIAYNSVVGAILFLTTTSLYKREESSF